MEDLIVVRTTKLEMKFNKEGGIFHSDFLNISKPKDIIPIGTEIKLEFNGDKMTIAWQEGKQEKKKILNICFQHIVSCHLREYTPTYKYSRKNPPN
jgi:hypothetical protein